MIPWIAQNRMIVEVENVVRVIIIVTVEHIVS